jgi:hypothetical protein
VRLVARAERILLLSALALLVLSMALDAGGTAMRAAASSGSIGWLTLAVLARTRHRRDPRHARTPEFSLHRLLSGHHKRSGPTFGAKRQVSKLSVVIRDRAEASFAVRNAGPS